MSVLTVIIDAAGVGRQFFDHLQEAAELSALTTEESLRRRLRLFRANAYAQGGLTEAASVLYQAIIRDPASDAASRGWALHGLATDAENDQLESTLLFERAGDAFMEAGEYRHATNDYLITANALRHRSPGRVLALFDRVLAFLGNDNPMSAADRALILQSRAELLWARGQLDAALSSALEAVTLRAPLTGIEEAKSSSMYMAAQLAEALSQTERANELRAAADKIADNFTGHAATRRRFSIACETGNTASLEAIRAEAIAQEDAQLEALCDICTALHSSLPFEERIAMADRARLQIQRADLPRQDREIVVHAFAELYRKHGDESRALIWYLRLLDIAPENEMAARQAIRLLFKFQRWADAVQVLEAQVSLRGESADLLVPLGEALIASGRPHDAVQCALKAEESSTIKRVQDRARHLLKRAVAASKTVPSPTPIATRRAATLQDLEETLRSFRQHVEGSRRMEFWKRVKMAKTASKANRATNQATSQHEWRERPEAIAKTMLWSFLEGRLPGVEILHEVPAGPGRMDLYIRFEGGERIVVELKMLGGGRYSATYAEEGFDQLCEYMNACKTNVGYLVAFDARTRDQGKQLTRATEAKDRAVYVLQVDVQPTVKRQDSSSTSSARRSPRPTDRRRVARPRRAGGERPSRASAGRGRPRSNGSRRAS